MKIGRQCSDPTVQQSITPINLIDNIFRIQTPGNSGIGRSFHDRPAIRENTDLIAFDFKSNYKFIHFHDAQPGKMYRKFCQIERGFFIWQNLNRIAP